MESQCYIPLNSIQFNVIESNIPLNAMLLTGISVKCMLYGVESKLIQCYGMESQFNVIVGNEA